MSRLNFFAGATKTAVEDARQYILPLKEPVQVNRAENGMLQLAWQEIAERTIIHAVPDPFDFSPSAPILSVSQGREAVVAGLAPNRRHYFRLEFRGGAWDGRSLPAAERIVPLQKGFNLRDAGGYYTGDGQMVRWGVLYRSGSLSRLTQADQAYLQHLGLRLVCDLRSMSEQRRDPDRMPSYAGLVERSLPMESVDRWERLRGAFYVLLRKGRLDDYMLDGYRRVMIDGNAHIIGEIFNRLADREQLPALIHCTAGIDRTGVVCAMLLLALGVPEETVIADYTLSNLFFEHFKAGLIAELKQIAPWGIPADYLQDLLLVKAKTLRGALTHLRQKYGSLEDYLRDAAGVSDETLQHLREIWLVPVD